MRVVLREPTRRDRDEFVRLVRASRRLHRPWVRPPDTPARFAKYLGRPDLERLLVCRRTDGAIAGVVNMSQIARGVFRNAVLGYYAMAPLAGRGYMTEGMRLVLRRAFTTMRLHRVEANVQPGNAASAALLGRCGFRREGFSPRFVKIGGRWRDHERWAITVEDWRRGRGRRRRAASAP